MSWKMDGMRSLNTTTGAHSMREHRLAKREQAEERNAQTLPERTKRYRLAPAVSEALAAAKDAQ